MQLSDLEPKLNVTNFSHIPFNNGASSIIVFNDGLTYPLGSKQRISAEYARIMKLQNPGLAELVYAGPANAAGAYAIAYGALKNGLKATLFLSGTQIPENMKVLELSQNVSINVVRGNLETTNTKAAEYIASKNETVPDSVMLVPFGGKDELFMNLLYNSLVGDPQVQRLISAQPKRIWLATGSGTFLTVLMKLFPNTTFLAVQVSKSLPAELAAKREVIAFWSPEKFSQPARTPPPYPAMPNYDGKIWQFVLKHAQDGDLIWNIL